MTTFSRTTPHFYNLLDGLLERSKNNAVFTTDFDNVITSWSRGAEELFGYSPEETLGQRADSLLRPSAPLPNLSIDSSLGIASFSNPGYELYVRKGGSALWIDGAECQMFDESGASGSLYILNNADVKKSEHDRIVRAATIDPLTGLLNRDAFDARLDELSASTSRTGQTLLMLMIDLDRFKQVNDTYGHHFGDQILRQAVLRIGACCRRGDVIGRLGGDEFAILHPNASTPSAGGAHAAKICEALAAPYFVEGSEVRISASIGIAAFPHDATTCRDLIRNADLALYKAKKAGRSRFHYFTDELDREAHQIGVDSAELRRIVEHRLFWLEYQPIVDSFTERAVSVEALIRFPGPILGHREVGSVIRLAQDIGLITEIGKSVFSQACERLKHWKSAGMTELTMCVNTCAVELLDKTYLPSVIAAVQAAGLSPRDIDIELTERDAIEVENSGSGVLGELKSLGFMLTLDDFGTGYSSLSYLRSLPVDTLKLDKSFLQGLPGNVEANAIAETVVKLAVVLSLDVVAEGVEDASQAELLKKIGCTFLQGYLFSPALSASGTWEWLITNRSVPVDSEALFSQVPQ